MKRNRNLVKRGALALSLLGLLAITSCGVSNPMAPTEASAPSTNDNAAYQIGTGEEGGLGSGGAVNPGAGGTGGATESTDGSPRPGRRMGHIKHGRP